ncbi:hypothetical protein G3N95_05100 [Paraburkholderia sp. Tr-20389]|uniref:sensor histidine kinase n=1 Tax=Paraburkholderia sp. Tr-20389 TaxID=2703903 RepID=UPI001980914C|nr:ATP-binding protein [Paraburkholderia sp. Tr-20389]MBN3752305.1 hypothetical protein [Paraburkholderia sp. Tr-20389]
MRFWARVAIFLVGLAVIVPACAGDVAKVVLLTGADPVQPAALVQIQAVRETLEASPSKDVEVYLEALDGFRFDGQDLSNEYLALLEKKYRGQHIDLVIVIANPAADFALKFHSLIWSTTPVLLSSVPEDWLRSRTLPDGFSVIPYRIDAGETLSLAALLQPDANRLIVVGGIADVDRRFTSLVIEAARHDRARWQSSEAWEGLPIDELKRRLSALDTKTAVVYTTMYRDRDGHRYFPYEVVPSITKASAAPVYGWYAVYLQYGLTAGAVYDLAENGRRTGRAALSVLEGRSTGAIGLPALPARCVVNASEAERFGLDTARLAEDCSLVAQPPSIYREYRSTVLLSAGVLLAQSLTIAALLMQRRRRRRAEAESSARSAELARAARISTVGELSASIAHEVGQPLGAILSNADAADLLVRASTVDVDELQAILADVRRDALRANDVVKRLRALLQKQSAGSRPLSLNAVVDSALVLIRPEARRRRIRVEMTLDPKGTMVLGDEVQLQQIVLNLAVNAMDAMNLIEPEQRILSIAIGAVDERAELSVADRGAGIDADDVRRLFEPFYTSKPNGMGLGLAIVRSIVDAHGGDIEAASRQGGGALFTVWLPRFADASCESGIATSLPNAGPGDASRAYAMVRPATHRADQGHAI